MRRVKLEYPDSPREVWCYDGRENVHGVDCYVWFRHLVVPDESGFSMYSYAHAVESFWPHVGSIVQSEPNQEGDH
ncbi:hypothetical protein SEA_ARCUSANGELUS_91 [Mycobacterium phage ArcusAngelus]|uniref:Uncharacterized protein n=1 Tax=Mycobacterium phage ArcusAngelus TaxID=2315613 RepID=A0A386KS14_9CAUD|nr:hypothetical protein I5H13_gp090 [Mycobacterium phage ArcusAngelus]AYD87839.1 hypothetical protein SEA_ARCUSANGELUS_91 [Mycobacterium phage ArcusAngelus]